MQQLRSEFNQSPSPYISMTSPEEMKGMALLQNNNINPNQTNIQPNNQSPFGYAYPT